MARQRSLTPEEFRQRTWDTLMKNKATLAEIINNGVDITKPQHLVVARGCALWVQICYKEQHKADNQESQRTA